MTLVFRNQVTKFVLFLVGRVGSTYLTSLLSSHPEIVALSEELRDREAEGAEAQLDWTRRFLTPPLVGRHKARGFSTKLVHIVDPNEFAQLLREQRCKIFHMQRRNRIKAVVSRINGGRLHESTGMYGLFDPSNRVSPLSIDPEQFDEYLKHRERMDQDLTDYVQSLHLPTKLLYYEDLLHDEGAFLGEVFSFLGVDSKAVQGETLKITSDNLKQVIVNFSELRSRYAGTQYEKMFDEVIVP